MNKGLFLIDHSLHVCVRSPVGLGLVLSLLCIVVLARHLPFVLFLLSNPSLFSLLFLLAIQLLQLLLLFNCLEDKVIAFQLEAGWQFDVQNSRLIGVCINAYIPVLVLAGLEGRQGKLFDWLLPWSNLGVLGVG